MRDQVCGAVLELRWRTIGVLAACAVLACAFAPAGLADGLKPDPSPAPGGLAPDSASTPAPAKRTTPKPVARATPSTAVAPVLTRTVVVQAPAAPAPTPVTRAAPKPSPPKPKVVRAAEPKAKPHVSLPRRVLPFGFRFAAAGANTTVSAASLALPAALAFVAFVGASAGFLALVYRLRREFAQV
jgi:hypothetical protein